MIEVQGKYCTAKVYTDNIEEAAYKPMSEIMENIGPTADLVQTIVPIYNFKASE